jgi:hypothetical protein
MGAFYLYFVSSAGGHQLNRSDLLAAHLAALRAIVIEAPITQEFLNGQEPEPIENLAMDRGQGLAAAIRPRGKSAAPRGAAHGRRWRGPNLGATYDGRRVPAVVVGLETCQSRH